MNAAASVPLNTTGWICLAAAGTVTIGIALAWFDRSLDGFIGRKKWCGPTATRWVLTVLATHACTSIAVSALLAYGPEWPKVHNLPTVCAAILIWVAATQGLLRASWGPADLDSSLQLRTLLEAIVRRSRKCREEVFSARFRELIDRDGDDDIPSCIHQAIEAISCRGSSPQGDALTQIGSLTELMELIIAEPKDLKLRARSYMAVREAIEKHGLLPSEFGLAEFKKT